VLKTVLDRTQRAALRRYLRHRVLHSLDRGRRAELRGDVYLRDAQSFRTHVAHRDEHRLAAVRAYLTHDRVFQVAGGSLVLGEHEREAVGYLHVGEVGGGYRGGVLRELQGAGAGITGIEQDAAFHGGFAVVYRDFAGDDGTLIEIKVCQYRTFRQNTVLCNIVIATYLSGSSLLSESDTALHNFYRSTPIKQNSAVVKSVTGTGRPYLAVDR